MKTIKITKFNNTNLKDLRVAIDSAVAEALSKFGLSGSLGKITYDETVFNAKLTVSTTDGGQVIFEKYASLYKLNPEWFGKQLESNGVVYAITGLNLKSNKHPVVATTSDGKTVEFPAEAVRIQLGDAKKVREELAHQHRVDYEEQAGGVFSEYSPLNLAWLDKTIVVNNEPMTIVGLAKKGRKNLILLRDSSDGSDTKAMAQDTFITVLNQPNNKALRDMPKMSLKDYLAAQKNVA